MSDRESVCPRCGGGVDRSDCWHEFHGPDPSLYVRTEKLCTHGWPTCPLAGEHTHSAWRPASSDEIRRAALELGAPSEIDVDTARLAARALARRPETAPLAEAIDSLADAYVAAVARLAALEADGDMVVLSSGQAAEVLAALRACEADRWVIEPDTLAALEGS